MPARRLGSYVVRTGVPRAVSARRSAAETPFTSVILSSRCAGAIRALSFHRPGSSEPRPLDGVRSELRQAAPWWAASALLAAAGRRLPRRAAVRGLAAAAAAEALVRRVTSRDVGRSRGPLPRRLRIRPGRSPDPCRWPLATDTPKPRSTTDFGDSRKPGRSLRLPATMAAGGQAVEGSRVTDGELALAVRHELREDPQVDHRAIAVMSVQLPRPRDHLGADVAS